MVAEDVPRAEGSTSLLFFFGGEGHPYSRIKNVPDEYKEPLVQGAICLLLNHLLTRYSWSVELTNHYWWLESFGGKPTNLPAHDLIDARLVEVPFWNEVIGGSDATVLAVVRRSPAFPGSMLPPFYDPDATSRLALSANRPDISWLSERLTRSGGTGDVYATLLERGEVVVETVEHPWLGVHIRSGVRVEDLVPGSLRPSLGRLPPLHRKGGLETRRSGAGRNR